MREQDATVIRSPLQQLLIAGTKKADVLRTYKFQVGLSAQQAADDAPIEVLIRNEEEHHPASGLRRANKRARIPVGSIRFSISARVRSASASAANM